MERFVYSPRMAAAITRLAARHDLELGQPGASLALALSGRYERWLITTLSGARLSVTHCWVEGDEELAPDLDMVFALSTAGWEPLELVYADEIWHTYTQAAEVNGTPVYDEHGDIYFACFTEYWAHQLQQQGWVTHAYPVAVQEGGRGCDFPDTLSGRLPGCHSNHPGPCYGELWCCAACTKTVCYAEGTDNHPELCDSCWVKQYGPQEEENDVPF